MYIFLSGWLNGETAGPKIQGSYGFDRGNTKPYGIKKGSTANRIISKLKNTDGIDACSCEGLVPKTVGALAKMVIIYYHRGKRYNVLNTRWRDNEKVQGSKDLKKKMKRRTKMLHKGNIYIYVHINIYKYINI